MQRNDLEAGTPAGIALAAAIPAGDVPILGCAPTVVPDQGLAAPASAHA